MATAPTNPDDSDPVTVNIKGIGKFSSSAMQAIYNSGLQQTTTMPHTQAFPSSHTHGFGGGWYADQAKPRKPWTLAEEVSAAMKENRSIVGPFIHGEATTSVEHPPERIYVIIDRRKEVGEHGRVIVSDSANVRVECKRLNAEFLAQATADGELK